MKLNWRKTLFLDWNAGVRSLREDTMCLNAVSRSICGFGPVSWEGAKQQQGGKGTNDSYFPWFLSLGCTKTVVIMIFFVFQFLPFSDDNWKIFLVCVCSRWIPSCILFQWHNFAILIISLVLRVIYNEGTCSFVFGFMLEEFTFPYDMSGKAI